jgi:RHH-type rel operon transcriptional repressor/antitoxin RelB
MTEVVGPKSRYTCIAGSDLHPHTFEEHTMLAIRLPEEIEARLDNLAKRTGRSKTFYAREAILKHLDDLEDLYLAEQAVQRIRSGEEQTASLDEVEARLGLAD